MNRKLSELTQKIQTTQAKYPHRLMDASASQLCGALWNSSTVNGVGQGSLESNIATMLVAEK
jgi:hypothetical protein